MRIIWLACLLVAACDDGSSQSDDDAEVVDLGSEDAATDLASPPEDATPPDAAVDAAPDAGPLSPAEQLMAVPESEALTLPGLTDAVQVLRTEGNIPHIYATNRLDLQRVHGFFVGRDRYLMMDLARRLAQGRVSALLGDLGLATDITSRNQGMPLVAERVAASLSPERRAEYQAFAEGISHYVSLVKAGQAEPPSELVFVAPILGADSAGDLMEPFTVDDVAAYAATIIYRTGWDDIDLEHASALSRMAGHFEGEAFAELRAAGLREDIYERVQPIEPVTSQDGRVQAKRRSRVRQQVDLELPRNLLEGLQGRILKTMGLLGRKERDSMGSNAWAVAKEANPEGWGLLAGDGHLQLSVPALFYQIGMDTKVLGGEDFSLRGMVLPGMPPLGVGTNGHVAWSFTYFYADVTDWYREEIQVGAEGPEATRFGEEWRPLRAVDETYTLAAIPFLGSEGGEATVRRWETYDGRRLMAIEGRAVTEEAPAEEGDVVVNLGDGPWVVADQDGDGVITGISMDYAAFDIGNSLEGYHELAEAKNLDEFRESQRKLAFFGSHFAATDSTGRVLSTGYHASPCRANLPRGEDGRFAPGADPTALIDGTRFGGFTVRLGEDGLADESDDSGEHCVVKFEDFPHVLDPERGFAFTANNDPNGNSLDGNLANDEVYVGGSWSLGFRAATIHDTLAHHVAEQTATVESMSALQNEHTSVTAKRYLDLLLAAVDHGRELQNVDESLDPEMARLAALYSADFEPIAERLRAWRDRGAIAESGVETFYHSPTAEQREDAVATMIWNVWLGHFVRGIFSDEDFPGAERISDLVGRFRSMDTVLMGRGPDNPLQLASWNPETGESVFFDRIDTPEVERSEEIILAALAEGLEFLRSAPEETEGGFGTEDPSEWLWGLRHRVRFDHLLLEVAGDEPQLEAILGRFGITPTGLPLLDDLPRDDERRRLPGFPRPGDNFNVDAAHPRVNGRRFDYRSGPVMRMVIALKDGLVRGVNIIPGGQSGLTDSDNFADQAAEWLGNRVWPFRFHLEQVIEGATAREVYRPE